VIREGRPLGAFGRMRSAALNSAAGLREAYRSERAFREELWAAVVLGPIGLWLGDDWVECALLCGSLALVLIVELLNSAIEAVVDRVSLDWHELSRRAKDLASAAVFLSVLLAVGIWVGAIWQRLA
jgi:diacylglycerol kinase (ATP)